MKNNKLITYHIGGRAGSIGFPINKKYEHEVKHYIFDADETCIDQIKEKMPNSEVLNFCIGKNNQPNRFYLNYDPYTSSLYKFNKKYKNFYHKNGSYDYLYGKVFESKKILKTKTTSLDFLVKKKLICPPDYLSIDTQGSEFDILEGSKNILKKNILAVNTEVSFSELYIGSKLFFNLDKFMKNKGFYLANIKLINLGVLRIPEAFRGKGIPLQAEAIYFKKKDEIFKNKSKLKKLAYIAICHGYTELAYDLIKNIKISNKKEKIDFYLMLNQFKDLIKSYEKKLPTLWHKKNSYKSSLNRFNSKLKLKPIRKEKLITRIQRKLFNFIQKFFMIFCIKFENTYYLNTAQKFFKKEGFDVAVKEIFLRKKSKL